MNKLINEGRDFRIIPQNFESATVFEVKNVDEKFFEINLNLANQKELEDYIVGEEVEIFGSGSQGLIFFVAKILEKNSNTLKVEIPQSIQNIQRREYSRVKFFGEVFLDGSAENIISIKDISAGGIRLFTKKPLDISKDYQIKICLINNMTIECVMHPIRIQEKELDGKTIYAASACFKEISSIDRVALVQYSLKVLMEAETKQNGR